MRNVKSLVLALALVFGTAFFYQAASFAAETSATTDQTTDKTDKKVEKKREKKKPGVKKRHHKKAETVPAPKATPSPAATT